jgi:Dockerin type I domain
MGVGYALIIPIIFMFASNKATHFMASDNAVVTACVFLLIGCQMAQSQGAQTDLIGNQLTVSVRATTSFDQTTGLYTYSYIVFNSPNSAEAVEDFAIELGGLVTPDIMNPASPTGWTFGVHSDRPIVSWAATDAAGVSPDPSGGNPPSPFQIKPGQQLAGFTFQSHTARGPVTYYALGYVKGPVAVPGDLDDEHDSQSVPEFTQAGINGTTIGPVSTAVRGSPSVRDFVVVASPKSGSILASPVSVQLKLAIDGETVDRTTFHGVLNGIDVTRAFAAGTGDVDLQSSFVLGKSPLQSGNNDFIVTVSGVDPNGGGPAVGINKVTFSVARTVPGDVNGDGVVDCVDAAIVIAALGKTTGQPGFDSAADVNSDGVIDVRDLTFVAQKIPPGSHCPTAVPPAANGCDGVYSGLLSGNLMVTRGQACLFVGGGVRGHVQQTGGTFVITNATIGDDVEIERGGTLSIGPSTSIGGHIEIHGLPGSGIANQICGANIRGGLELENNAAPIVIGSASDGFPCLGNTIGGNVEVQNNSGPILVINNTISGQLECEHNVSIIAGPNSARSTEGQCRPGASGNSHDGGDDGRDSGEDLKGHK